MRLGISDGCILGIEPRFRGLEIVAPTGREDWALGSYRLSHWERDGDRGVWLRTVTFGNPNNRTPATQGMCLEVEMPRSASVVAEINGEVVRYAIATFAEGARAGRTGNIGSAGYRFHRASE